MALDVLQLGGEQALRARAPLALDDALQTLDLHKRVAAQLNLLLERRDARGARLRRQRGLAPRLLQASLGVVRAGGGLFQRLVGSRLSVPQPQLHVLHLRVRSLQRRLAGFDARRAVLLRRRRVAARLRQLRFGVLGARDEVARRIQLLTQTRGFLLGGLDARATVHGSLVRGRLQHLELTEDALELLLGARLPVLQPAPQVLHLRRRRARVRVVLRRRLRGFARPRQHRLRLTELLVALLQVDHQRLGLVLRSLDARAAVLRRGGRLAPHVVQVARGGARLRRRRSRLLQHARHPPHLLVLRLHSLRPLHGTRLGGA